MKRNRAWIKAVTDESSKLCAESKKPDTKEYIFIFLFI